MMKTALVSTVTFILCNALLHPASAATSEPASYFPQACLEELGEVSPITLWTSPNFKLTRVYTFGPTHGITTISTLPALLRVWRLGCDTRRAALLMSLGNTATNDPSPLFISLPNLWATQNGRTVELFAVRSDDGSRVPAGATGFNPSNLGVVAATLVISTMDANVDLNRRFTLTIQDHLQPGAVTTLEIPDYLPNAETYASAYGPRSISGRYAGNFYDPAKPGEGIVVEIGDMPGADNSRFVQFSWHSFDNNGQPFWISGGKTFTGRARQLRMPAAYRTGGRFGGAVAAAELKTWGTVDIEFSDCNTVQLNYAATDGLPNNVPAGSGRLQWQRLTSTSGYSCE